MKKINIQSEIYTYNGVGLGIAIERIYRSVHININFLFLNVLIEISYNKL
jgi:hypothetical protein